MVTKGAAGPPRLVACRAYSGRSFALGALARIVALNLFGIKGGK